MSFDFLEETILNSALSLWDLPAKSKIRLINVSENLTYLVEANGIPKSILRVHRPDYRSQQEIESELIWLDRIQYENLIATPTVFRGKDAARIQNIKSPNTGRLVNLVMFEFVEGSNPEADDDQSELFHSLGEMAAILHKQARLWTRPADFFRQHWNLEAIIGDKPLWGKWQDAPGVTGEIFSILSRAEKLLCDKIIAFDQSNRNYGLIHADMRLANILRNNDHLTLIDFDDCGFGWYLYDFAASVSFMETRTDLEKLKHEWMKGYRGLEPLSENDERLIDSFVMLRRLALLAWVGSHMDSDEPKKLAPFFAHESAELAENYLSSQRVTS